MRQFWKIYDGLETALTVLALSTTVLMVLASATGRAIGTPVQSGPQFASAFLIWAVILGADMTMKRGEHIRVSAIADTLPPLAQRALTCLHLALILPFLAFLIWYGFSLVQSNWQRPLGASGLSYGLVTMALPVGAVLFAISILRRVIGQGLGATLQPADDHEESVL